MVESSVPFYTLLVSLIAIPFIGLSGKSPNLRESWTLIASVIKILMVLSMVPDVLEGKTIYTHLGSILPGLDIAFRVDALGMIFAVPASLLWLITSMYSIGYMRSLNEHDQTRYYIFFSVAISATLGIAFSANVFTLFLFYEILTLSTYPLVIHQQTQESLQAGRRYLTYLLGTSFAFLLTAVFLTYHTAGTLEFSRQGILTGKTSDLMVTLIFILFLAGTTKAGLVPLHSWLPAAMVAPTPVSALLHAVAVVKAGVFTIVRISLDIFGIDLLRDVGLGMGLVYFSSFTVIVASLVALRQDNLKRRLAYSTISQLAYVVLGVALLTPGGIYGSTLQIVVHAFGKITLFFCAGAIYVAAHKTKVSELNGIGKKMPLTMIAFTIGAFSMIGVPLTGGFISKWYLLMGAIEAHHIFAIGVLIISTILNAAYFLPIIHAAFLKDLPDREEPRIQEAPPWMIGPILVTAVGTILLFVAPSFFMKIAGLVVGSLNGGSS
ncbi:MAG TPA: monovalent cation/H+ antiporter subunit D family protein [Nitrospiria bacterium]|jgi:multicomponent Na+:H+ antiporter subunit D